MASSVPSTFKMGISVVIAAEMHEILNAMSHVLSLCGAKCICERLRGEKDEKC